MSLFEDTNPRALKELLSEIHARSTVLPDFQRDFVWEPNATQELIVSIANNYPAGSLLRVRDPQGFFACREFEGAPPIDGHKHTFLVLDGQQRLTSLYQAFYGVGEHRYYLDLKKLLSGNDFDEAIFYERATTKKVKRYDTFEHQSKELILPLSVLKGGAGGFLEWLFNVTNPLPPADRLGMQDGLRQINEKWIKTIDDYHFPVVTLSDKTEAPALCTIFETLNRTGVKLSVFELLTARFWPQNINLRALWDEAREAHKLIEEFEVDPYYVLQAIALGVVGRAPTCKRSDVLSLMVGDIESGWKPAVLGLAKALEILRDDGGVVLAKWLPYQTMLITLSAVLAKAGAPNSPIAGVHREKLKRWFWCAVFGQAYENAPNSQSAKDFTELVKWLQDGPEPEVVSTFRFDPNALRDVTPRQRSIYRGILCLILGNDARDFHSQAVITGKLIEAEGIDDHHIFPADFLEKKKGIKGSRQRDCVLNRTLIDRTTNQLISNRAPSDYLKEIKSTKGFPFENVLTSHFLPADDDSPFWTDDYDRFLAWRQECLWEEIKRVTGAMEAADLEAENADER